MILSIITAIEFPSWISGNIFTIPGPTPDSPPRFALKWYGVAYVVGLFGAYLYAVSLTKKRELWIQDKPTRIPEVVPTKDMLSDLMFYCLIGIIVGGRLGYVALYSPETFLTPIEVLKVWTGGMSFHGGFLGVVAACAYASWKFKIDKFRIGDMASVGAPIGLGMVRFFGNFFNQELYGRETNVPWGMKFNIFDRFGEKALDAAGNPIFLDPRHPSQLYEAFLEGLVLFLILRFMTVKYKALTKPGLLFGALMFFYGLFRFGVEFVREPDNIPQFGILTRGMAYSLPMVLAGAILMLWASRRAPVSPKRIAEND